MKNPLSDMYEQVLLNEAEKHNLQNPSSDEVGNLKTKQDLFGTKPKAVEGPDKAKLVQGPAYKETSGSTSAPKSTKTSMPHSSPAKQPKTEKGEEMEDTEVDPTKDEEKEKKVKKESFAMSAFETLFKKTLTEEIDEMTPSDIEETGDLEMNQDSEEQHEESEEGMEEEEADLVSDLRELQDKLAAILDKLEDIASEEETEESEEDYSDEDFEDEFGEGESEEEGEEGSFKESMDRPKPLNNSKGKGLMNKKNKVGRLSAKGGKAHGGSLKNEPNPKSLGDKKKSLQKGRPEVKSTVKKGDFIK